MSASFEGFPFIVGWELTLACNLHCSHCGSSAGHARENEMTTAEALALCAQFPPLLVREVNFTGGEPLLRPDWHRLAARLGADGITTKIISNGLLLNQDTVDQMKDVGIAGVGVSLDGLESTHDGIRGYTGQYRRVMSGLDLVIKAGITVTVITTASARNVDEFPTMYGILCSRGVDRWQIQPVFPTGRARHASSFNLSDEGYLKFGEFIGHACNQPLQNGLQVMAADSYGYYTQRDTRTPAWGGCSAGLVSCGITSDGKVKGCLSMPDDLIEDDLRQHDLWDIWFHPDAFAYTRRFSLNDLGPNCRGCDKGDQCRGGCTTMSYGSTGRCHNDPLCFYAIANRAQRPAAAPDNR